jgi:hypothetical protein
MSQELMDSFYDYGYGFYDYNSDGDYDDEYDLAGNNPDPCEVSSSPSFRIDVKNVAAVS